MSEEGDIARFEPRLGPFCEVPVVWAIHASRLQNYLLPRDCPRVTYYAGPQTAPADVERYLGSSPGVVAFERAWLDRVRACRLYCYHLPEAGFTCVDECAGYYVSRETVVPARVQIVDDLLGALCDRGVEVRILPSLWALRDAVVASTLAFSVIRMRNAGPREAIPPR
jgi:hypothetical protein